MMFVYVLKSQKDGRIYVGITYNIDRRVREHNAGRTKSTKGYRPWKLMHFQGVNDRFAARNLEKKWKSGSGKEFLKVICACSSAG
jgi:putative endonuclease